MRAPQPSLPACGSESSQGDRPSPCLGQTDEHRMLSAATCHSLFSWQLWRASGGAGDIDEKTGLERLKDCTPWVTPEPAPRRKKPRGPGESSLNPPSVGSVGVGKSLGFGVWITLGMSPGTQLCVPMGKSLFLSLRSLISKVGALIPALPASMDEGGGEHGSICLVLATARVCSAPSSPRW